MKVLTYGWLGFICWFSLIHIPGHLAGTMAFIPNVDKVVHFTAYAVLAALLYKAFTKYIWTVLFICTGYGLLMELCQKWFTTYRSFEWADVLADFTGAMAGYTIIAWITKRLS